MQFIRIAAAMVAVCAVGVSARAQAPAKSSSRQVAEGYKLHADKLAREGRFDQAVREYRTALSIDEGYAEAHNELGLVYFAQRKVSQAITEYRLALTRRGDFPGARYNLAYTLRRASRFAESAVEYRRFLQGTPNDPDGHYGLGEALKATGDKAGARAAFERYIVLEKRPTEAQWVGRAKTEVAAITAAGIAANPAALRVTSTVDTPSLQPAVGASAPVVTAAAAAAYAQPVTFTVAKAIGAPAAQPAPVVAAAPVVFAAPVVALAPVVVAAPVVALAPVVVAAPVMAVAPVIAPVPVTAPVALAKPLAVAVVAPLPPLVAPAASLDSLFAPAKRIGAETVAAKPVVASAVKPVVASAVKPVAVAPAPAPAVSQVNLALPPSSANPAVAAPMVMPSTAPAPELIAGPTKLAALGLQGEPMAPMKRARRVRAVPETAPAPAPVVLALGTRSESVTMADTMAKGGGPDALVTQATAAFRLRDYATAKTRLIAAAQAAPSRADIQYKLAAAHAATGDLRAASSAWGIVLQLEPRNDSARDYLMRAREKLGMIAPIASDVPTAATPEVGASVARAHAFGRAFAKSGDRALLLSQAEALMAVGRYAEATGILLEAASLDSNDPRPYYHLASCHRRLGDENQSAYFARLYLRVVSSADPSARTRIVVARRWAKTALDKR